MHIKEGRILCMESCMKYMVVGTSKGSLIVFDAETKKRKNVIQLKDAVLSLKVLPKKSCILLGLACGEMMLCSANELTCAGIYIYFSSFFYRSLLQIWAFGHL